MKVRMVLCMTVVLALASTLCGEDLVMFHYQGKVKVQGQPYDGTGYFKFAIVNNPGTVTLWSNDGTSVNGGEPTAAVTVSVSDGIFNVMIGDPALGMEPINRSIFNHPSQIKLRTWFSDGVHGFEQLLPDRRIINPTLIGIISGDQDFTIYVNDATGNDENNGLTTDTAKKTIQAAVDVLPERLRCNVTIDIADGIYREEVKVYGITVQPGKSLTFLGDESWTPSSPGDPAVRVTGTDNDGTHERVRSYGLIARNCSTVVLNGILFDYASSLGTMFNQGSCSLLNCKASHNGTHGFGFHSHATATIVDCVATYNGNYGFFVYYNSNVNITSCEAYYNNEHGISLGHSSVGYLTNCVTKFNGESGVNLNTLVSVNFHGTGEFSNNTVDGIHVIHKSMAKFGGDYSGQINNNGDWGINIAWDSLTTAHTRNSFSGNGNGDVQTICGGNTY